MAADLYCGQVRSNKFLTGIVVLMCDGYLNNLIQKRKEKRVTY